MGEQINEYKHRVQNMTEAEIKEEMKKVQEQLNERIEHSLNLRQLEVPSVSVENRVFLQQKMHMLRDRLLEIGYNKTQRITEDIPFNSDISWGIRATEPQEVFTRKTGRPYWVKVGRQEPVNIGETLTISKCGEFKWLAESGLEIDEIESRQTRVPFNVPCTEDGNGVKHISLEDIKAGISHAEREKGKLDIIKVSIEGTPSIQYFMLCSLPDSNEIYSEEFKEFITRVCVSAPHEKMLRRSFEEDVSIYVGKFKRENGIYITEVSDHEAIAVASADKALGTCKLPNGRKKFGNLQDVLDKLMLIFSREGFCRGATGQITNKPTGR